MSRLSSALRRAVAVGAVLTLMAVVAAAPAVAAKPTKCLVIDPTRDTSYKSLQAAVDASPAGTKLRVKGTCVRPTTISRDIKIVGKSGHGFGRATLDGDHRGSVLTIQGGTVTLRGLLITHGTAPSGGGIYARGSFQHPSSVTLIDTVVSGNSATGSRWLQGGGGVGIDIGTITLVDSIVRDNTASYGGGIMTGGGTVDIVDSIVRDNTASYGGGICNWGSREVSLRGTSAVTGNHATDGGGIGVDHGRLYLLDRSAVDHNAADGYGGGVYCSDCEGVALNGDSSIHHNTAGVAGGGLGAPGFGGPLHMRDRSSIHDNTAPIGGGVWLVQGASLDMAGTSSISRNAASVAGGGAYLSMRASLAVGATATVSGNVPDNCYSDSPPGVVACTP